MLNFFRTNQLLFSVLLIFYAAILHLVVFIEPIKWEPISYGYFSGLLYDWIGFNGLIPDLIVIFLLFIQATAINSLVATHRLDDTITLFPGLFYILIASALPRFLHLSPLHLANTFYLIALMELFKVYKKPFAAENIFNVGFWISVGSLFYCSYAVFIIWGIIGLNILRAFNLQELLMLLIGAFVPYILSSTYVFWVDQWDIFFKRQFVTSIGFLDFRFVNEPETYLKIIFVDLFLLVAIFSYNLYNYKKNIQVQKKFTVLYWGLFFSAFTLFFQAGIQNDHLLILVLPLGIMLSINFTNMSRRWAEIIHLFILLIIFIFQYQQYLLPT